MNQHFSLRCNVPLHPANFAVFASHYYRKCWDNKFEKWFAYQARKT